MPIYTYKCRKCGQMFPMMQSMNEEPITSVGKHKSPTDKWCKGNVFRVVGAAAIHFKGHGFHNTDYSRK